MLVATAVLCAVLAGTALAVDTSAAAAFDAPKRLVALIGVALAALFAFGWPARERGRGSPWREARRLPRAALALTIAALLAGLASAWLSPRRGVSLDALRSIALLCLLLPLGASRLFPTAGRWLAGAFLAACSLNAAVSLLQSRGTFRPFLLQTSGERQDTGAYAGNVGYLAITLALGAVLALGLAVLSRGRPRAFGAAAFLLMAAGLVVNRNLTALTSALAGAAVLLALRYRRRAVMPILAATLAAALAVIAYPPLRQRAGELARAARSGNWDALVSFRGGPWAAAVEMARERPLAGYGPGTFAAEYVPHRLAAEIRARRRFVSPLVTSSYGEAHSDYLQVFADAGIPAGVSAALAVASLLAAIRARAARSGDIESILLSALLITGAAAALTWFPMQRPITAVPILLAAGRAWRISASDERGSRPEE